MVVAAMYAAWQMQQFLQRKVEPRKSMQRFLLFLLLNAAAVFFIIIVVGFTIIHFKEFFFKQ
jgi:predicted PurR-regulated permease PerM